MPFNQTPNQPILFEDNSFSNQSCINTDNQQYAVLAQQDDTICIQFYNYSACGENACSPEAFNYIEINNLIDWVEYHGTMFDPNFTFDTAPPSKWHAPFLEAFSYNIPVEDFAMGYDFSSYGFGKILISFEYTFYGGGVTPDNLLVQISDLSGTSKGYVMQDDTNNNKNIDGRMTLVLDSANTTHILFQTYAGNDVGVKNLRVSKFDDCCFEIESMWPDLNGYNVDQYWQYVESCNGWQCRDSVALVSTIPLTNGVNYLISFTITDLQVGQTLQVSNDSGTIQTITTNGTYNIQYTHGGLTGEVIRFRSTDGFEGVICGIQICDNCTTDLAFAIYDQYGDRLSKFYDETDADWPINYTDNYVTWCVELDNLEDVDDKRFALPCGFYRIGFIGCNNVPILSTSVINYAGPEATDVHECTYLIQGICKDIGFGFYFGNIDAPTFSLNQRLRALHFNPVYRVNAQTYLYSDGSRNKNYAEITKEREILFDYVDENTHDVIATQLFCDRLLIDGVEYTSVDEDYEPLWKENGKKNLAQSKATLISTKNKTIFNKNCK